MTKEMPRSPRHNPLIDTAEDLALGVGRFGYGLLSWGLGLLPSQSRQHMHNAIRELSYGFASLPGDFAEIAGREIERWAEDDHEDRTSRSGGQTLVATEVTGSVAPVTRLTASFAAPAAEPPALSVAPASVTSLAALAPAPVAESPAAEPPAIDAPVAEPPAIDAPVAEPPATDAPVAEPPTTATPLITTTTGVTISHLEYNPATGRDVDGEYVEITNGTPEAVDLTGWSLHDGDKRHSFTFPRFRLAAGASVKVWTRQGRNDQANLYWGRRSAIWNNSGDTGTLTDAAGHTVSSYSYVGDDKRK